MAVRNPIFEYVENELNMDALVEAEAEHMKRRRESIDEFLMCLEELKSLLGGFAAHGRIAAEDDRD